MRNVLIAGMSRPIDMDFGLDEVLKTLPGSDKGLASIDGMKFDLEGTMDSMPKQGHRSDIEPSPVPLKRKNLADQGRRSQVAKETPQPSDEPIEVAPIPRSGPSSRTRGERKDSLPNFGFLPTRGYHEMGVLKSLVTLVRAKAIAGRSEDDIERAATVFL